ncbi:MAG: hypothetical protein QOK33_3120, partial [Mycobacterium sp.]|nr:hypothetical protein [Mycobacterium sp.]
MENKRPKTAAVPVASDSATVKSRVRALLRVRRRAAGSILSTHTSMAWVS